jgi:hypothetical protein
MEKDQESKKESDEQKTNAEEALKIVRETKKELAAYRKPFEADWKKYDDAYYGKQHKTGEDIKTVKNHIFKIIEGEIPLLTDSMPSTQITASREDKQQTAEILGKAIKYVHQDQNLPLLLPSLLRSASMSAPGYLYAYYNPDAECGNGKIEYRQLPWTSVFLDGNAQTIEQSEKCRIEINMRKDSLARTWPEFADQIKALGADGKLGQQGDDDNFEKRDVSGKDAEMGKPKAFKGKDVLVYAETWIKDYSLEDIEKEETESDIKEEVDALKSKNPPEIEKWQNHDAHIASLKNLRNEMTTSVGLPSDLPFDELRSQVEQILQQNPQAQQLSEGLLIIKMIDDAVDQHEEFKKLNPTSQEPKFEDGWRVIKSVGDLILYDGENPEEGGEIPLVPFYTYKDDSIYGFGIIKNILNAQQTLNDVDFRELEGLRVCSNPGWIVDHEAEVTDTDLTNKPGIVVSKKKGTEVRRLEPGQVSPQLEQRKQGDQLSMESIEGMNEQSMNGAMPVGNASGVAVQKVQTQPIGRIRLKGRNLEYYSMRRLALITACLIENHWTEEKCLRLRADDNSIEEVTYNPIEMEDLEYMIDVSPGSMAGVDKDQLIAFYLTLLNTNHIDFEMFLAACPEFPGKHTLVKSYKEKNQQQQQIQQAQQQYEQTIQQQQQQMQEMQAQNIKLRGVLESGKTVTADMLMPEEKKIFEQQGKQAVLKGVLDQHDQEMGNMEPTTANQNNQGPM